MKVIRTAFKDLKGLAKGAAVTIGVFDGVHIGHREIIKRAVECARRSRLKSVVFTFDPHPLKVLHPRPEMSQSLVSLDHRIRLIESLGVDCLVILKFTKPLSRLPAEEFVRKAILDKAGAKALYVGEDFCFGRRAEGDSKALKALAGRLGFRVEVVKPVKVGGVPVSSSLIRRCIRKGDIHQAAKLLGRPVSVLGTVVAGSRLARQLGYPTANINPHHEVVPPAGVYAVLVRLDGKSFKGILNIGTRPTFYAPCDREPAIEAHIFDFHHRIYGKSLEILFMGKLRNEARFKDRKELISQIKRDEIMAHSILKLS